MNIALIAATSLTDQVEENLNTLFAKARAAKGQGADLALFGEAFLQGFEALTFEYESDIHKCLSLGSQAIARILAFCKQEGIALGVGYYENDHGAIYASYLLVGEEGQVLANYRRVSPGWKEPGAHADYREGKHFLSVRYKGRELAVIVCGDFWEDELLPQIIEMDDRPTPSSGRYTVTMMSAPGRPRRRRNTKSAASCWRRPCCLSTTIQRNRTAPRAVYTTGTRGTPSPNRTWGRRASC